MLSSACSTLGLRVVTQSLFSPPDEHVEGRTGNQLLIVMRGLLQILPSTCSSGDLNSPANALTGTHVPTLTCQVVIVSQP